VYVVDVAVAALGIVAYLDEKERGSSAGVGVFEPPPPPTAIVAEGRRSGSVLSFVIEHATGGRSSRGSQRTGGGKSGFGRVRSVRVGKKKKRSRGSGGEQYEMEDLESQNSSLGKAYGEGEEEEEKLPGCLRALVGLVTVTFKCFVWCVTVMLKAVLGCLGLFARCCGLGKL